MSNLFRPAYDQLTVPERAFVDAYVANMQEEAKLAGESLSAIMGRVVPEQHVLASRGFLTRSLVLAAIAAQVAKIVAQTELSPRRLINEYMAVAFSNMKHYFDSDYVAPQLNLYHLTNEQWAAVSDLQIDYHANGMVKQVKIKLHPKMDALARLGEYMAVLYRDNQYWKAEQATGVKRLKGDITPDQAADAYARMIAG